MPPRSHKKSDSDRKLDSLEAAKDAFLYRLWRLIPPKLRLPFAAVVVIGGTLIATESSWRPLIDSWFFTPPPPTIFGGYIFASEKTPLQTEVRLLDTEKNEVTRMTSDPNGLVGFNIPGDVKLSAIECRTETGWQSFPIAQDRGKESRKFIIDLSTGSITIQ